MSWQERVADKKKRLDATIPDAWRIKDVPSTASVIDFPKGSGLLSEEELAITETSAVDLVQRMAVGVLTSVAVTTAFCKRAAMAQQLLNCTLEFFPEKALARAKELDDYYAANEKVVGPLHGLPISLKDQFRIKVSEIPGNC
jgi:amidase